MMEETTPEEHYRKKTSPSYRKALGQYFTPPAIARLMSSWILPTHPNSILDPAAGLGIFTEQYEQLNSTHKPLWNLYDTDQSILAGARERLSSYRASYLQEDFLFSDWNDSFEAVIANPPYFKLSTHQRKQDILQQFNSMLNMQLPGNTNMYNLFVLKSAYQLVQGGRAAYIVPSDFLNADYGRWVKDFLVAEGLLQYVIVTDYQHSWFDDALTTSAILLCEKGGNNEEVEFLTMDTADDIPAVQQYISECKQSSTPFGKRYHLRELDTAKKWRSYYQNSVMDSLQHVVPFQQVAAASRGIATGANDFFCLTASEITTYQLSDSYLTPCITKANQVETPFFSQQELNYLIEKNMPVYLLNVQKDTKMDPSLVHYIQLGEYAQFHKRYLTKHRSPWYKAEVRKPAPIWFRVFNRERLHFVRNEAGIVHLTPYHSIYIHPSYKQDTDVLMAYFLTDIASQVMKETGREYGKGLVKFEPNDINHSYIVDIDAIDHSTKQTIQSLYEDIRLCSYQSSKWYERKEALEYVFRSIILSKNDRVV
ncbi:class I SAM-dependent DNA methyltransferase [Pontibacillus salicampi]|uniref:site-specific DNA-methyltransferase (adenine-specific) n=1 Tax=Pontibacillus salicampi TaxID=1449801 RepID=A0ABV6LRW1_9BACI